MPPDQDAEYVAPEKAEPRLRMAVAHLLDASHDLMENHPTMGTVAGPMAMLVGGLAQAAESVADLLEVSS